MFGIKELWQRVRRTASEGAERIEAIPAALTDKRDRDIWTALDKHIHTYRANAALPNDFDQHYTRVQLFALLISRGYSGYQSKPIDQLLVAKLSEVIERNRKVSLSDMQTQETWLGEQLAAVKNYMSEAYPGLPIVNVSTSSLIEEMQRQPLGIDTTPWKVSIM